MAISDFIASKTNIVLAMLNTPNVDTAHEVIKEVLKYNHTAIRDNCFFLECVSLVISEMECI